MLPLQSIALATTTCSGGGAFLLHVLSTPSWIVNGQTSTKGSNMHTEIPATRAALPASFEVQLERFTVPEPGRGRVLVAPGGTAISAATEPGICTAVPQWLADPTRACATFPLVAGYSGVGHVRATGDHRELWRPGDRLLLAARQA